MKTPKEILAEHDCYQSPTDQLDGRIISTNVDRFERAMETYAEQFKPRWISVKDKLPDLYLNVLCLHQSRNLVQLGSFDGEEWIIKELFEVTHWLPIPPLV